MQSPELSTLPAFNAKENIVDGVFPSVIFKPGGGGMLTEIEMSDRKTNQNATLPIHHTSSHTNTQHVNLILKHAENEVEKEA